MEDQDQKLVNTPDNSGAGSEIESQSTGLLPCPFCGGEAAWGDGEQKHTYGNEQAYCTNCYAMTAPEMEKDEAAAWWNVRVGFIANDGDAITLAMDNVTAITISRALKVFSEDLYSGDQAGRIQRGNADYIRAHIDEAVRLLASKPDTKTSEASNNRDDTIDGQASK